MTKDQRGLYTFFRNIIGMQQIILFFSMVEKYRQPNKRYKKYIYLYNINNFFILYQLSGFLSFLNKKIIKFIVLKEEDEDEDDDDNYADTKTDRIESKKNDYGAKG